MSKVTPRPWQMWRRGKIGPNSEPEIWIGIDHPEWGELSHMTVRAGCGEAAEVGSMEANAAHIVKCVNMHEELVAALRMAFDSARGIPKNTMDTMLALLAKAEAK